MNNVASLACAVLFCILSITGAVSQELAPFHKALARDGSQGQDFWVCFPPNEREGFPTVALMVQISSAYDCQVTVEADGREPRTYAVKADTILVLTDQVGSTDWAWEIWEAGRVVPKGIHITSTQPVTVSVLNSKQTSSDAYLAVPVSDWTTSYRPCSYYDFNEVGVHTWAGGFVVMAAEDATEVTIELRGTGGNKAKTRDGRKIGETFTVMLNKGDVYRVAGDATTRGVFDLTGSSITANRPIGVVSYHERTTMPNLLVDGNGRNNLLEMNRGVAQWDTMYVTREFNREHHDPKWYGRGDVFRVVASESNTKWTCTYYSLEPPFATLGTDGGVLANAGDFADLKQSGAPKDLIYGYSVWKADKPVQVVQYSCSQSWDGDPNLDPFMIDLVPVSRFLRASVVQPMQLANFPKHIVNLIVQVDSTSTDVEADLKSLQIDGVSIWNHPRAVAPLLTSGMIPGTSCYGASIELAASPKPLQITSNGNVRFSGYLFGFGAADSYGLPLAGTNAFASDQDIIPPIVDVDTAALAGIMVYAQDPTETASGMFRIGFVDAPVNATIGSIAYMSVDGIRDRNVMTATVKPVDPSLPMQARICAVDNSGNASYADVRRSAIGTSVADVSKNRPFVSPLPAHDVFVARAPESYGAIRRIIIRDLLGSTLHNVDYTDAALYSISVPCSGLAAGRYTVELQCTSGVASAPLVIQR